jgi:mannose-6-phosphate isomerase-like protein (cupin superfamily)
MPEEPQVLKLTAEESVRIVPTEGSDLLVEATYGGGGGPPPAHMHPAQDERFEVLEGSISTRVAGEERTLAAGDTIEIPRGVAHQMWNPGSSPAKVSWTTSPAGRTEEWFRALDGLQREGKTDSKGLPSPLAFAVVADEFGDTFRLSVGPAFVSATAIKALAIAGRLRGHRAP